MINDDPIYDIRVAVASVLRKFSVQCDHKQFADAVADALPDFFRRPLSDIADESTRSGDVPELTRTIERSVDRLARLFGMQAANSQYPENQPYCAEDFLNV